MTKTYFSLLKHRVFLGCTLIAGFVVAAGTTYNTISSYVFQKQFFLSPVTFGWVTAITAVGSILGRVIGPHFIKKISGVRTQNVGLWLVLLSGILLLWFIERSAVSVSFILIAVIVMRLGQALIMPMTSSRALSSFHDRRGSASALYSSTQLFVAFVVAFFVGGSSFEGVAMLAITFVVMGLLALIVYYYLLVEPKEPLYCQIPKST